MGLKKVVVLSMAVVLLLVAVSTSVSAARADPDPVLDIFELLSAKNQGYSKSSAVRVVRGKNVRGDNAEGCCDSCVCTQSVPPECACEDRFEGNKCQNSGCENCLCPLIYPPFCWCTDITNSCKPACSSSATISITDENEAANTLIKKYVGSN